MRRTSSFRTALMLVSLAGLGASALLTGCGTTSAGPMDVSGRYILALCDADMTATAMVDGKLGSRNPEDKDVATIIGLPIADGSDARYNTPYAQIPVSNSVIGPPQAVAVTLDGRWAYVIEHTGQAGEGATTVAELPPGNKLTRLDLANPTSPVEAGVMTVGENPIAVDVSPDGTLLCVVSEQARKQLQIIPISGGTMGEAVEWPLVGLDDDENTVPSCVTWHPSGEFLAVTIPTNNQVKFYRVKKDSGSIGVVPWGEPVTVGKYPYSGKFTPDGKFYITTDVQWDDEAGAGMFIEPPQGVLSVVRFDASAENPAHEVVAATPVGVNPEGLAISPDGKLVVTANLLRSFLHESDPRVTRGGSLSLLKLDAATGTLTPVDEYPLDSMPVGLSFDAKGGFIVVTQFRSFNPEVKSGELGFYQVHGGNSPKLTKSDFQVGVGKGPHGVLIVR